MKVKQITFFTIFCLAILCCKAKEIDLIDCENTSMWSGNVEINKETKLNGKFSFISHGKYPTYTTWNDYIEVEADKIYTLSCQMRSLDSKYLASGYMGLHMYDKYKRKITLSNVVVIPGTNSELLFEAEKGTKILFIKLNKKILKNKTAKIAFNVKDDYSDLPNFELSSQINDIVIVDNYLKLVLKSPLNKTYITGTEIRLHSPYMASFYWAAEGWMPVIWKKFSIKINGINNSKGSSNTKFWKGTKYVKPFFCFGNWNRRPASEARLLVDDFCFKTKK